MEQVSMGMALIIKDMPDYKRDLQTIKFQLCKQDIRLDCIQRHIPCIIEMTPTTGDPAEDPANIESKQEDPKE